MILSSSSDSHKPDSLENMAQDLKGFIDQAVQKGLTFDEFETSLFQRVLAIGATAVDLLLKAQGNGDLGPTVQTAEQGTLHRSSTPQPRRLRSLFGEHTFDAYVYAPGSKHKIALRPIDARLNLPGHKASYLFEEISQLFCIDKAFGVASQQFERIFGQQISVDVLETINRDLGQQADAFLEQELSQPTQKEEGELLVATADGKGVPLVKADARQVPAFDQQERPGNRRMATLGCIYTVDRYVRTPEQIVAALFRDKTVPQPPDRPESCGKRYRSYFAYQEPGEEPLPGAIRTWTWLAQETAARHRPGQPLIRLMDGQPTLWESAQACLEEFLEQCQQANQDIELIDILDILHVASYVWKAAKVFHSHKEQQEAFVEERLLKILKGEVAGVVRGLRRMASLHNLEGDRRAEIETVCTYFENHVAQMRYDEYLRAGYPIATGVIEGACRHVIKDRMEQGGMRWTLTGATAMLNLRAVNASSEAEAFHQWRKEDQAKRIHPHRQLVAAYTPLPV